MSKFIQIGETNLECFENGTILRFWKQTKKWNVVKGTNVKGYLVMKIDKEWYGMHRVLAHTFDILDLHSELLIDHIDRNRSNNYISNLRPATSQQNSFNQGAKGYSFEKQTKKWKSTICLDGNRMTIGRYNTEEEARQAYLDAKEIYHKF
jgi:hypothetical protein